MGLPHSLVGSKTANLRLAAPGETAGVHVLRYLVQLNLSALAALTKYSDRGLTRQHCVFSQSRRSLWLIGRLLPVSLHGLPSVHVSVLISSTCKDLSHVGLGPCCLSLDHSFGILKEIIDICTPGSQLLFYVYSLNHGK